jgi:catechol-2,3-dioxygenase
MPEGSGLRNRQLGHVVLKVRNAARSRDFYRRTLGLKVSLEDAALGAVFLSVGETHHDLALFQVATGAGADATQPGLHHMAWRLGSFEELQAAYESSRSSEYPSSPRSTTTSLEASTSRIQTATVWSCTATWW